MKQNISIHKMRQLTAIIERESDGYVSACQELGIVSQGKTVEEAGLTAVTQNQLIEIIKNMKDEAYKKYKATLKGIFGSYARGEAKEDSDIDILVEFHSNATLLDLTGLANFLEEKLEHKVDIVSQNAVREEIKPYIYSEILYL